MALQQRELEVQRGNIRKMVLKPDKFALLTSSVIL